MPDSARERVIQASTQLFEQLGGSDIEHLRTVPLDQVRQVSRVLSSTRPAPGQVHTPANLVGRHHRSSAAQVHSRPLANSPATPADQLHSTDADQDLRDCRPDPQYWCVRR
jgi:hypothetical protein